MKKFRITHHLVALSAVCVALASATAAEATNLSDTDKQFLAGYEKAHAALAADDLSAAIGGTRYYLVDLFF